MLSVQSAQRDEERRDTEPDTDSRAGIVSEVRQDWQQLKEGR